MLVKYQYNRKALDDLLKSIHPINKKSKVCGSIDTRISDYCPVMYCTVDINTARAISNYEATRVNVFKNFSPLRSKNQTKASSPVPSKSPLIRLSGSPLNINKRLTPLPTRVKQRKFVAKVPFVKWTAN